MKKTAHAIAILFFFLLLMINTSPSLARFLESKQGEAAYLAEREEIDSLDLMGLEDCNSGDDDEECAKRRMVAEAHLDYIYTQHRNKP
ncbi:putative phytosulfokines 6 isoform X2 [Rhododendron vialii]|uniref:putative phytosulfokines 6 isoform X2 n=1 Tax=Rhododendron vialii TaxID=182163 RepID=UPI00265DC804|nr:putative phytosulfokines 6 isoform X2 [Rhododendron vialii]